jgi:uncharacterized membrane protein YfcA
MELYFYLFFFVGIFLGLFGGGGGILIVPILTQITKINYFLATKYSLILVGITALIGSLYHLKKKNILFKEAFYIIIPATITSIITRNFIYDIIPITIFGISKDTILYLIFIVMMILSALMMLEFKFKKTTFKKINKNKDNKKLELFSISIFLGLLTGLTGLGGGFLIVPIMIAYFNSEIKKAISTSLFIIAINLVITFLFEMNMDLDYVFLMQSLIATILGFILGIYILNRTNTQILKKLFAIFLLVLSIILLYTNF